MVGVGQTLSFILVATDADEDPLTYELETALLGAGIEPFTGEFIWARKATKAGSIPWWQR
jgi:hypothetical protein